MDIDILAPSLMSLSQMIKRANFLANGKDAPIRLEIKADIAANCVTVELAAVLSYWQYMKGLLVDPEVVAIKELLEWMGLISTISGGAIYLLRRMAKAKVKETRFIFGDVVIILTDEDGEMRLSEFAYKLVNDSQFKKYAAAFFAPLQEQGIDLLSTEIQGKPESRLQITKEEAIDIRTGCGVDADSELPDPQYTEATLRPRRGEFDENSTKWKFDWDDTTITVDISATSIAPDAKERGAIYIDDSYRVLLEQSFERTPAGRIAQRFKIMQVIEFIPGKGGA